MFRVNRSENRLDRLDKRRFADVDVREREHLQEWLVRTLRSLARGGSAESMTFERDGRTVETAFNQQLFFLAVSGKVIEE